MTPKEYRLKKDGKFRLAKIRYFAFTIFICSIADFAVASASSPARSNSIPPSWRTSRNRTVSNTQKIRPWYRPKIALGGGFNVPEILPLEVMLLFGDYFGTRFFFAPELPLHARVEMPSDVISTKRGLGVANPNFTINLDIRYGPQYGFELLHFPFGQSLFIGTGWSVRSMKVDGFAKSNILVCSLIEAAKEPPCGNPNARIETQTELEIDAKIKSTAELGRFLVGGFWHIGPTGYFAIMSGFTIPLTVGRTSKVSAGLDTSASSEPEITGALAEIKREKEVELEAKAIKEMRPVDEKILPLLGFSLGVRL